MEAEILHHTQFSAEDWDSFIVQSPQGMIYHKYHYISKLAPNWQAIIVKNGNQFLAVMPIEIKSKFGIKYAKQPIFAQYWGICLPLLSSKISRRYELYKQYISAIINKIPRQLKIYHYHYSPHFNYSLPFLWHSYKIAPRFTYQINLRQPIDEVYAEFAENTRRDIKKAEKAGLKIKLHTNFDALLNISERSWGKKVKNVKTCEYQQLKQVYEHFVKTGESFILTGETENNEIAGGILFFTFRTTTIYYFGGTAPEFKHSGVMSLIIWEAIKKAHSEKYEVFDFDGSMIEPIEKFLRGFGAEPVQYLSVSKKRLPFS